MTESSQSKALSLIRFLRELVTLNHKAVRNLDDYEDTLWFSSVPQRPECYCVTWDSENDDQIKDVWIEVQQPNSEPPPPLPDLLSGLILETTLRDFSLQYPPLRTDFHNVSEEIIGQSRQDWCLQITESHEEYVETLWEPWAEKEREQKKVKKFYQRIFSLYQRYKRQGEQYELLGSVVMRYEAIELDSGYVPQRGKTRCSSHNASQHHANVSAFQRHFQPDGVHGTSLCRSYVEPFDSSLEESPDTYRSSRIGQ